MVERLCLCHDPSYLAGVAKRYADNSVNDEDTCLAVYRCAFEQKFENSSWIPKYEAKEENVGNYSWNEFLVQVFSVLNSKNKTFISSKYSI